MAKRLTAQRALHFRVRDIEVKKLAGAFVVALILVYMIH